MMAEVARQIHDADAGIPIAQPERRLERRIRRSVIDEHDLVLGAELRDRIHAPVVKLLEVRRGPVHRRDD